jgi:crossover junction endodeoxyribonuclease RuvC
MAARSMHHTVLGFDPGLTRFGWGAVDVHGSKLSYAGSGVVTTSRDADPGERLANMFAALQAVLADVRPASVAMEQVLFNLNVRTAMATGQVAGVALLACAQAGLPVARYAPSQVKLAVAGYGAAAKPHMCRAVARFLDLSVEPPPDAGDALALAICHATAAPLARQVKRISAATDPRRRLQSAIAAKLAEG